MTHPILTLRSYAILAGFTGFLYYLSLSFDGPWQSKYQIPERERQKYLDIPEFAANFDPSSHPASKKRAKGQS